MIRKGKANEIQLIDLWQDLNKKKKVKVISVDDLSHM